MKAAATVTSIVKIMAYLNIFLYDVNLVIRDKREKLTLFIHVSGPVFLS